jgi:hypothetical protein
MKKVYTIDFCKVYVNVTVLRLRLSANPEENKKESLYFAAA